MQAPGPVPVPRVIVSIAFRWACFALMTVMAVWNESRPGTKIRDVILEHTPFISWVHDWNYWIWLVAWLPGCVALLLVDRRRFVRLMLCGGILSLLRGLCIVVTALGPVRGPDVNFIHDWDWALRLEVVTRILNPISAMADGSANIWLTKDLFFSGHAATCMLLLLYVWPHRRLRLWVGLSSIPVTLSLFLGHIHYTIDVFGAWIVAYLVFALCERHWRPRSNRDRSHAAERRL